jgi:hypothetical protein
MKPDNFITHFKDWIKAKLTGVVTIYFHDGGIRKVEIKHEVK